jgi:hypothetical protein
LRKRLLESINRQNKTEKMARKSRGVDKIWKAEREAGFSAAKLGSLPDYDALHDSNLRHHFESRKRQSHLHKNGLIDHEGRVIDERRAKSKLFIIEQEFKVAEKAERMRLQEEAEMRVCSSQQYH